MVRLIGLPYAREDCAPGACDLLTAREVAELHELNDHAHCHAMAATCPVCGAVIRLGQAKDFESHTGSEYAAHYAAQHQGPSIDEACLSDPSHQLHSHDGRTSR